MDDENLLRYKRILLGKALSQAFPFVCQIERKKTMKIIKQMMIIATITFVGELLNLILPLPVPGSVYGMILLFLCLQMNIIKLSQIEETADFLIAIMPIMFISPCVSLVDSVGSIADSIPALVCICIITTITTMSVTGIVAQVIIQKRRKRES